MKRIISLVLAVFALSGMLLSLASCHGSREPLDEFIVPDNFDTSKEYEITFWAKHESNVEQKRVYTEAVDNFQKLYPNIKVTIKDYTNYNDIYNDVITNIQTGTTPNVCITYPDHIATYMQGDNVVVPLDSLIADEKYGLGGSDIRFDSPSVSEIVPKFLQECVIDGKQYAMPYMRSTEALYINKDLLLKLVDEIPEVITWDFIFDVCEKALEKNPDGTYKVNGQTTLIPFIYKSTDNMMIQMLEQMGAPYSKENGEILIFNDDTKKILYTVAEAAGSRAFSTFKISSYPGNFLNKGQCIFAIDSTAGATWMGTQAPHIDISEDSLAKFETVVMPIPQYDVRNPKMISQGPSVCIFNKEDSGEVLASWLFVQYLLSNDVQIAYAQTEGYLPVTTKAQKSAEFRDYLSRAGEKDENGDEKRLYYSVKIAATKLMFNNIENSFVTPVFNGSVSLRNAAGQMIEDVAKSARRNQKINESYMEELFDKMVSLYRLDTIIPTEAEDESLPAASIALLASIGGVWAVLGTVAVVKLVYRKK